MTVHQYKKIICDNKNQKLGITTQTRVKDVKEVLNRIGQQYQEKEKQTERLREQLKNFKAQVYKNEELAKIKESYDRMEKDYYRGFPISKESKDKIQNWIKTHEDKHHGKYPAYHGVSGGGYQYIFSPTAIGTAQSCYCSSCKMKAIEESQGNIKKYRQLLKQYDAYCDFTEDW